MGKMGGFSSSDLRRFQKQLEKVTERDADKFVESCAKELAARLLAKVIKRTPVRKYPKGSGKMGGTLRRGWTSQASGSGSEGLKTNGAAQYVDTLKVNHFGGMIIIEIINPVDYASYVEFGHRTRNHKGWVPGRFMMTISEKEVQTIAPKILEKKIEKFLRECMG